MSRLLVVFDVDSTLIQDEVIELLADFAGVREQVAAVTERAMAGELDFTESLIARVATLEGLSEQIFDRALQQIRVSTGAEQLIAAIHANGGLVGAVSGGFNQLLNPLAKRLNLDYWRANELEVIDGKLTGRVSGNIIDKTAKAEALDEWAAQSGVASHQTIAVGDGANDLEMMRHAALSVAFNAKPVVRDLASIVIHGDDLAQLIPIISS